MNNKGISNLFLLIMIIGGFIGIVILGVYIYAFSTLNTYLGQNIQIGQVNLATANSATYGQFANVLLNYGDTFGQIIIFALCISMGGIGYFLGSKTNKAWIFVDVILLVVMFIFSVYISRVYDMLIHTATIGDIYINTLPKSSKLLLNLPIITSTVGVIMMIITYSGISRDKKLEVPNVGEF